MDIYRINKLRTLLCDAKDFHKIFEYFMDHLGENLEFIEQSEPTTNDLLEKTVDQLAKSMCGARTIVGELKLLAVPNTDFIHGGCVVNDRMGTVLYFDDIQTGILGVFSLEPGVNCLYSRFRLQQLPKGSVPSPN